MAHQVTAATLSIPPVTTRPVQIFALCLEFDQALTGGLASDQQSKQNGGNASQPVLEGFAILYVPEALNRRHPGGTFLRLARMFITAGLTIDFRSASKALPRG